MSRTTTVLLSESQKQWIEQQPRTFSFSALMRELLADYLLNLKTSEGIEE